MVIATTVVIAISVFIPEIHSQPARTTVKFGIDNLVDTKFELLRNKKVALLTNIASRTRFLEESVKVLAETDKLNLCALLVPEHGYFAQVPAGELVSGEIIYGIPTYSLYGKNRRPTKNMIGNCDAVVIDLQDIGVRPYTFISTMYNVMDACAEYRIPVYILDRPNPLGGLVVDGNIVEEDAKSFVGIVPVPYLHGMTMGELAMMINEEGWLQKDFKGVPRKCDLTVVKMKRWRRDMTWENTQTVWIPTSPNIASVNAIRGMALTGLLGEISLCSIGIGTGLPFQYLGMPNFNIENLESKFKQFKDYGIKAMPTRFTPTTGKYANTQCNGVLFAFQTPQNCKLYSSSIEILLGLRKTYPTYFQDTLIHSNKQAMFVKILGSKDIFEKLTSKTATDDEIRALARKGLTEFISKREKYLLYN